MGFDFRQLAPHVSSLVGIALSLGTERVWKPDIPAGTKKDEINRMSHSSKHWVWRKRRFSCVCSGRSPDLWWVTPTRQRGAFIEGRRQMCQKFEACPEFWNRS